LPLWEGRINRADIMERFGVSVPQASKDLSLYEEKAPGNLVYDRSEKRYFASPNFKPAFLKPDADRYLNQLRSVAGRVLPPEEAWLSEKPDSDAMPIPHRRIGVHVLRSIVAASRRKRSLEIVYQSMNAARPDPQWRWITPHAFGNDGLRWHVRAYCHIDNKFKDFLLSRCLDAGSEGEPGAKPSDDVHWDEFFEVILSPNPLLGKNQQEVIAQDYNMVDGHVSIPVRKALLYYFQKRLRLDVPGTRDNLHETPVVIANRETFTAALAEAMA
jgi:hypothetical protein